MSNRTNRSFLLAFSGIAISCSSAPDPAREVDAIRALIEHTEAMNNQADIEGWVALFEDGAVYMPDGLPAATTRDELRNMARTGFTSWRTRIRIQPDEIVPIGDWAFARARVTGTAAPIAGGEPVAIDLKEIVLFHRQPDRSWKIARLIANSNGS